MGILTGNGKVHLNGQKGLTKDQPILPIEAPDLVYIPLVIGNANDFEVHVSEGDHVYIGTKLATRKSMYVPIFASVSGTVKGIKKRMHCTKRMQNHIVIENDHKYERVKAIDIENPDDMSQEEVFNAMKEMGLIGLGGSGFPTYIKYNNPKDINTLIINGVECEPFLTSDHLSMKRDIKALYDGVHYMLIASNAPKAIICIKEHKPDLYELLVEEAKNYDNIEPREVPDRYPMGWERVLVKEITGKDYDRLPGEIGVIVNNASTAIALSKGIRKGEAITHRVVTFAGDGLKHNQNVEVAVGTPVNYIVDKLGGYVDDAPKGMVIAGGPMMGKSILNDQFVIYAHNNGITVLKSIENNPLPCLRCGSCTLHCPSHLQPVRIMQAEKAKNTDLLIKLEVTRCIECGTCTYICPSKIEVTDMVSKGKRRVNNANKGRR